MLGTAPPIMSDHIDTIGHLLGHNRLRQLDYGRRPDETRLAAEVEMLADVRDVDQRAM